VRLYTDGKQVGEHETLLADDQNVVNIAPIDPWEKERRFSGEIRDFTIWDQALGADAIATLAEKDGGKSTPTEAGDKEHKPR
jgi:alpha-mannosidase